jgi:hypothetical protein
MTDAAPFTAGYLPIPAASVEAIARGQKLAPAEVERRLASATAKLRAARAARRVPRDNKLLAGWNGLALAAYAEAAAATGEPVWHERASAVRAYLVERLWDGQALKRALAGTRAVGSAALEDYAYVADGLLAWARLTGRREDAALAARVADAGWRRFYGLQGFRLSDAATLPAEPGQDAIADGPMPSPSATLIAASLELARLTGERARRDQALAALNSGHARLEAEPFWHATHIGAMLAATR